VGRLLRDPSLSKGAALMRMLLPISEWGKRPPEPGEEASGRVTALAATGDQQGATDPGRLFKWTAA
jgi:hypothetical protein